MLKERVSHGLIVTNYYIEKELKEKVAEKNIIILDRKEFEEGIYD